MKKTFSTFLPYVAVVLCCLLPATSGIFFTSCSTKETIIEIVSRDTTIVRDTVVIHDTTRLESGVNGNAQRELDMEAPSYKQPNASTVPVFGQRL